MQSSKSHHDAFHQTEPVPVESGVRDACIALSTEWDAARYHEIFLHLAEAGIARARIYAVCTNGSQEKMYYIPNGIALEKYKESISLRKKHEGLCYEPLESKRQAADEPFSED